MRTSSTRLISLVVLALLAGCGDSGTDEGPLGISREHGSSTTGGPVRVGEFFVIGVSPPKNHGDEAVFESLEPAEPDRARGLEMRYAAVTVKYRCAVGSAKGWPPKQCVGLLRPVKGYRYGTQRALLLVGARAGQPGTRLIPAFRLRYRVGDRSYMAVYEQGMELRVTR